MSGKVKVTTSFKIGGREVSVHPVIGLPIVVILTILSIVLVVLSFILLPLTAIVHVIVRSYGGAGILYVENGILTTDLSPARFRRV